MAGNSEQIATEIHRNASEVLEKLKLEEYLHEYGEIFFSGSYVLDLMTSNDIDMQLMVNEGVNPIKAITSFLSHIMESQRFIKSKIIYFQGDYKPEMPRGIYLGFYLNFPALGGVWKFDLWILNSDEFHKNRVLVEKIQQMLTPEKKKLILGFKHEMQDKNGRVPQMGSHFLYQAILFKNLHLRDEVYQYLSEHGVKDAF